MTNENLLQLHQAHVWLHDHQLPGGANKGLHRVLTQKQLEQCQLGWEQLMELRAASKATATHQSVFDEVERLPPESWQQPPAMEQPTPDEAALVDILAVSAAGGKLAIEVDGPKHFVSPGNQLNGPTQDRNRALAARGHTVVSIPYWEWDALQTSAQQVKYLQRKLAPYVPV